MTAATPSPALPETGLIAVDSVPSSWRSSTIRQISRPVSRKGFPNLPVLSVYRDYGVILKDSRDDNHNATGEDLTQYKAVYPGDLVLNKMKTWQGSLGVSDHEGLVSPAYITCKTTPAENRRFLHHLLRSTPYIHEYHRISFGVRVGQWDMRYEDFREIPVYLPPRPEQDAIVAYLDGKLEAIDRYLRVKEREMALLEERKRALIHRAVTRGLDPNPQLQPSGIPWLPEIPAGWRPVKAGFYVEILSGYAFPSVGFTHDENDIVLLRGINVGVGSVRWDEVVRWPRDAARSLSRFALREGDLVMGMDRPWISAGMRVAQISSEDLPCLLLQRVARLRAKAPLTQAFLQLVLSTDLFIDYFTPILTGVSVPHLSPDQIGNFRFGLPSTGEQDSIVKLVEENATKIDTTITRAGRQIERMQEYRTALIAEAVTGKIDVTGRPN